MVNVVFNPVYSGFSISNPCSIISIFWDFLKLENLGIQCSIRSNKIRRSGEYRKQSKKQCDEDSSRNKQSHWGLSIKPIVNLCRFRSDLPTRIFVKREFDNLFPLEKCLQRRGLVFDFKYSLKSEMFLHRTFVGRLFQRIVVWGKKSH